jgi:hypothetical protein
VGGTVGFYYYRFVVFETTKVICVCATTDRDSDIVVCDRQDPIQSVGNGAYGASARSCCV